MENKIKENVDRLESVLVEVRKDEEGKNFAQFGERIIELVKENDYEEARFVTAAFKDCTLTFGKKCTEAMKKYINATVSLIASLPYGPGDRSDGGYYSD